MSFLDLFRLMLSSFLHVFFFFKINVYLFTANNDHEICFINTVDDSVFDFIFLNIVSEVPKIN